MKTRMRPCIASLIMGYLEESVLITMNIPLYKHYKNDISMTIVGVTSCTEKNYNVLVIL